MRLIDADVLKVDYLFPTTTTGTKCYQYVSMEQIQNAPAISPEPHWIPVVDQMEYKAGKDAVRKKGKWKRDRQRNIVCSVCGDKPFFSNSIYLNFCPNCGADMRGDENA